MKRTVLHLALIGPAVIGLTLCSARRGQSQTFQDASPPAAVASYEEPRPYYVSEAVNGNEAYPRLVVTQADVIDLGPATGTPAEANFGNACCDECLDECCPCPEESDWRTAAASFLRRCFRAVTWQGL